jgi:hypothetical protein
MSENRSKFITRIFILRTDGVNDNVIDKKMRFEDTDFTVNFVISSQNQEGSG